MSSENCQREEATGCIEGALTRLTYLWKRGGGGAGSAVSTDGVM